MGIWEPTLVSNGMKLTHKTFGAVAVSTKRITTGGNEVYDSVDETGQKLILLTDTRYWESITLLPYCPANLQPVLLLPVLDAVFNPHRGQAQSRP